MRAILLAVALVAGLALAGSAGASHNCTVDLQGGAEPIGHVQVCLPLCDLIVDTFNAATGGSAQCYH